LYCFWNFYLFQDCTCFWRVDHCYSSATLESLYFTGLVQVLYAITKHVPVHVLIIWQLVFVADIMRTMIGLHALIPGHYSSVMPTGRLCTCKNKTTSHIINNLLTSNVLVFLGKSQTSALQYWPSIRSVSVGKVLVWDFLIESSQSVDE